MPNCANNWIAGGFRPIGGADADNEQDIHRLEQRMALPLIADHAAKGEWQGGRDQQHRENGKDVRPCIGILEWMRGIGIEKAAAIGAELLDRLLAGDRTHGDRLLGAVERRRLERTQ